MIRILFLGDIVAKSGRNAVIAQLPKLIKTYQTDFVIANGENAAHGKGMTVKIYRSLMEAGVDVITLGNHAFSKKVLMEQMDECSNMIRPVNLEPKNVGKSVIQKVIKGKTIEVYNVLGTIFMDYVKEDPFECMETLLNQSKADIRIVDFHAEATSEKQLFYYYYREKLNAVIGTHTHIQTADEQVTKGCAYMSDAGMCGAFESIIGRDIDEIIRSRINHEKTHYTPSENPAVIQGCVFDIDEETCQTVAIQRIQIRPES